MRWLFVLFYFLCDNLTGILQAQDVSFSQYNVVAPYFNPAYTASFDGNYRIGIINREQWVGYADKAFQSFSLLGDIKFDLGNQNYHGDYFGAGMYFLTDRAPLFDWNTNEANILVSFHKLLNKNFHNYLSGGVGFGVTQKSINYENIYFEDQFDGLDKYNLPSKELLPPNIFTRPELKIGIQYNTLISKFIRMQTGLSGHYIFGSDLSFYKDFNNIDYVGNTSSKAFRRLVLQANLTYFEDKNNVWNPRLFYSLQGPHHLLNLGINYKRSFYSLNQTAIHLGISGKLIKNITSVSLSDLGLTTGFEWRNFILGIHYDIGLRDAFLYNNPTHSYEISLSLIGNYDNEGFICPEF